MSIADVLIIGHALFYDLLTVHYSVVAVALTPTARPIVGLAAIFVLRSLCQASVVRPCGAWERVVSRVLDTAVNHVQQLPCPRGFYWKYPGFPSMSIDYEPAAGPPRGCRCCMPSIMSRSRLLPTVPPRRLRIRRCVDIACVLCIPQTFSSLATQRRC